MFNFEVATLIYDRHKYANVRIRRRSAKSKNRQPVPAVCKPEGIIRKIGILLRMRILGSLLVSPSQWEGTKCCFLCELSQELFWGRVHAGAKQDVKSG